MDSISAAIEQAKATSANSPAAKFWQACRATEQKWLQTPISSADHDEDGTLCRFNPSDRSFCWIETVDNYQSNVTAGTVSEVKYPLAAQRITERNARVCPYSVVARELESRRQRGVAIQEAASLEQKKRRILIEHAPVKA